MVVLPDGCQNEHLVGRVAASPEIRQLAFSAVDYENVDSLYDCTDRKFVSDSRFVQLVAQWIAVI